MENNSLLSALQSPPLMSSPTMPTLTPATNQSSTPAKITRRRQPLDLSQRPSQATPPSTEVNTRPYVHHPMLDLHLLMQPGYNFTPPHPLYPAFEGIVKHTYHAMGYLAHSISNLQQSANSPPPATNSHSNNLPSNSYLYAKLLALEHDLKSHRLSANTASKKHRSRLDALEHRMNNLPSQVPPAETNAIPLFSNIEDLTAPPPAAPTVLLRTRVGRIRKATKPLGD
jgi:hypothetical protein